MITELSLQQVDATIKKMATDEKFSVHIKDILIQQFRVSRLLIQSTEGTATQESVTVEKNRITLA